MKSRLAILRLWILASLALGSALLLRSRNPETSPADTSANAPSPPAQLTAAPASYTELLPMAKTAEPKACCEKPPSRAALLQAASSTDRP